MKGVQQWRGWLIGLGGAALAVGVYLLVAYQRTDLGFPLDDAWIHQVFARNLALRGEFSYNPGVPVAGSTSPLWTFLLAPGYWLGFYSVWTYGLGIVFLALTAREVGRLAVLISGQERVRLWAALLTLFEWRLVWAGASGMETIVFAFGTLFLVNFYLAKLSEARDQRPEVRGQRPEDKQSAIYPQGNPSGRNLQSAVPKQSVILFLLGLVGGLLTLVRPEGMVLLGLAALDWSVRRWGQWRTVAAGLGLIGLGWAALVLPYFVFNYWLSGSLLPNTFGAKVSNYGDLSPDTIFTYLLNALQEIWLAGSGLILLLPGLVIVLFQLGKRGQRSGVRGQRPEDKQSTIYSQGNPSGRNLQSTIYNLQSTILRPLVWPVVVLGLYAVRLPVTYQHARYLMPLIPFLIAYGVVGTAFGLDWLRRQRLPMLARVVPLLIGLAWVIAWYNNSQSYQSDVKFINDEQVRVGRWLAANTPSDAVVASHDIGAIKYFSGRKLVDTAGLVSPEFVPIVRDPDAIYAKLKTEGVSYFAMLPAWYPNLYVELQNGPPIVFAPQETYLEQFGQKNMVVYKIR